MSYYTDITYLNGKVPKDGSGIEYTQIYISYQDNHGGGTQTVKGYQVTNTNRDWLRHNCPVSATCGYGSDLQLGYFSITSGQASQDVIYPFTFYSETAHYHYETEMGFQGPYHYTMLEPSRIYLHSIHAVYEIPQFQTYAGCIPLNAVLFRNYFEVAEIEPPAPSETPVESTFLDFTNTPANQRYTSEDYDPYGVFTSAGQDDQIWFDRMGRLITTQTSNNMVICVKPVIYDGDRIKLKLIYSASKELPDSYYTSLFESVQPQSFSFYEVAIPLGIHVNTHHYYEPPADDHPNETAVPIFNLEGDLFNFIGSPINNLFVLTTNNNDYLASILTETTYKSLRINDTDYYRSTSRDINQTVYVPNQLVSDLNNTETKVNDNIKLTRQILEYIGVSVNDNYEDNDTHGHDNTNDNNQVDDSGMNTNQGVPITNDPVKSTVDVPPFSGTDSDYYHDNYVNEIPPPATEEDTTKTPVKEECTCEKLDELIEIEKKSQGITSKELFVLGGYATLLLLIAL